MPLSPLGRTGKFSRGRGLDHNRNVRKKISASRTGNKMKKNVEIPKTRQQVSSYCTSLSALLPFSHVLERALDYPTFDSLMHNCSELPSEGILWLAGPQGRVVGVITTRDEEGTRTKRVVSTKKCAFFHYRWGVSPSPIFREEITLQARQARSNSDFSKFPVAFCTRLDISRQC